MSRFPLLKTRDIQRLRGLAEKRIFHLNTKSKDPTKDYVLYWMQMTQRTQFNFALRFAIEQANTYNVPLVVYQELCEDEPFASDRTFTFILQGVQELFTSFKKLGINYGFSLVHGKKGSALLDLLKQAVCVVSDDYPSFATPSCTSVAAQQCPVAHYLVDSCTTVPMRFFHQQALSAATIRSQTYKVFPEALEEVTLPSLRKKKAFSYPVSCLPADFDVAKEVSRSRIDHTVRPVSFQGGEHAAQERLQQFIAHDLDTYAATKDDPTLQRTSRLSPYLHFGMISPIDIALQVLHSKKLTVDRFLNSLITPDAVRVFLEELIVRRDLAYNFCHFNKHHATYRGLPAWGRKTLQDHGRDSRPSLYTLDQLERGKTHDAYWNAAQLEMAYSGRMHGYMRMYWCKQLLLWTKKPADAFMTAVFLNDKYQLDGRDPSGYAGIAWALGGLHDRPWFEKPVFGKIRVMNSRGLERKFNMQRYLAYAAALATRDTNSRTP